jgi:hypothetical protein
VTAICEEFRQSRGHPACSEIPIVVLICVLMAVGLADVSAQLGLETSPPCKGALGLSSCLEKGQPRAVEPVFHCCRLQQWNT